MDMPMSSYKKLLGTWFMLKMIYGLVPIIAGVDKLLNINFLVQWTQYLSNLITQIIPLDVVTIMRGVGVVEILAGLLVLSPMTRLGAWVVMFWLILIAVNLFSMGLFFDVAVRDIVMAAGALALARLTDVKEEIEEA